ncbi:MAG: Type IV pilus transmembrane protein FimT [candidate division WWE3 bacterium GW2011_GWF2_41_45]|uniref:General secretion pathway GspH domain-containing protein n=3 Tax=Katanobacteria TaxID=422282 RepID=A0A1F4W278_UNCKA|nr:MAG: Type IV pilus transmembrane protein FimT [candidate division WWE3 bacterium GW2011_GWC2_41_23]KKS10531.1 MAG: Type IV pilus transmembrane protein FimT [candidate division WWE3 bacterium GW2011_GWF2_41_45]KKS20274.1 MAG: Type IV pilus transmembrane protein FimT [candidate division WWE3 bacterium GW2011_GWE1_41_72]KKS30276.1 MAG: Type IV pilus transmembrane protein FimT [candidate division WWE3 bacterium GW2011_GWD2_42_11]KKS51030.1 MAG: Type IV pilus transmembrane protein FimT [candidate
MKLPRPINKGFTLVELMIVVSILAIVSGIMIPSFSSYTRNQTLKQAQENLKSDLRSLQNRALTGTGSDMLLNGLPAKYWAVSYSSTPGYNTTYSFYLTSTGVCSTTDPASSIQQTVTLPANVTISSSSAHCLLFSMEDGSVLEKNIAGVIAPITDTTIKLFHTSSTTSKDILINRAGMIKNAN